MIWVPRSFGRSRQSVHVITLVLSLSSLSSPVPIIILAPDPRRPAARLHVAEFQEIVSSPDLRTEVLYLLFNLLQVALWAGHSAVFCGEGEGHRGQEPKGDRAGSAELALKEDGPQMGAEAAAELVADAACLAGRLCVGNYSFQDAVQWGMRQSLLLLLSQIPSALCGRVVPPRRCTAPLCDVHHKHTQQGSLGKDGRGSFGQSRADLSVEFSDDEGSPGSPAKGGQAAVSSMETCSMQGRAQGESRAMTVWEAILPALLCAAHDNQSEWGAAGVETCDFVSCLARVASASDSCPPRSILFSFVASASDSCSR